MAYVVNGAKSAAYELPTALSRPAPAHVKQLELFYQSVLQCLVVCSLCK
jgi:hypothetical protein